MLNMLKKQNLNLNLVLLTLITFFLSIFFITNGPNLSQGISNYPYNQNIRQLNEIPCGDACDVSINLPPPDLNYKAMGNFASPQVRTLQPFVNKRFLCYQIMARMAKLTSITTTKISPPHPPVSMLSDYLMGGGMTFGKRMYFSNNFYDSNKTKLVITKQMIEQTRDSFMRGKSVGTYGRQNVANLYKIMKRYFDDPTYGLKGGDLKGLVVGSQSFWVEMLLLTLGVQRVTTFEYANLASTYPPIQPVFPYAFAERLIRNSTNREMKPLFDIGVSYSSLEHSGLGRYGDILNPYGDLETMAQIWCLVKPGGLFFLNVPFTPTAKGRIEWNAHRIYHWGRIIQMASNWIIIENSEPSNKFSNHKVFVLQKPKS